MNHNYGVSQVGKLQHFGVRILTPFKFALVALNESGGKDENN